MPCQNGHMTDVATRGSSELDSRYAHILLYSDNSDVREAVRFAVGNSIGTREVRWVETATHDATIAQIDERSFDVVILDGEAAKVGGMGISRQVKHELYNPPPVLLLVGRADDAWLATWSEADAAVAHPLDAFEVRAAVEEILALDD